MKTKTIKVPMPDGLHDAYGIVCHLKLDDKKTHKCFLQYGVDTVPSDLRGNPTLVDYRSGMIIKRAIVDPFFRLTDRQAAQDTIDMVIARNGVERFLTVCNSAPAING